MNDQTPWQETPCARAWKNFTESVEFRNLLDTSIKDGEDARYATNRLRCAFDMGWNSKTSVILDALNALSSKEDKAQ